MKKATAILVCVMMTILFLAGCAPPSVPAAATPAPAASAAPAGTDAAPASDVPWDPTIEPDRIYYDQLDELFGPMSDIEDQIDPDWQIGSVVAEASNEYWLMVAQGVKDVCAKYGMSADVQHAKDATDMAGQRAAVETMYGRGVYDAFVVNPMASDLISDLCLDMTSNGVPVVNAYCMYIPTASVFVGALDNLVAEQAAQYTIDALGGQGNVAIALGSVASVMTHLRCGNYKEFVEANSDITVAAELACEWDAQKAREMTEDLLTQRQDIDLIFCVNDDVALGVVEGLRAKNMIGQVKVVGMDGTNEAKESIKAKEMTATFDTNPYQEGTLSAEIAIRMLCGQKINRVVAGPITLVTQDNVDSIAP